MISARHRSETGPQNQPARPATQDDTPDHSPSCRPNLRSQKILGNERKTRALVLCQRRISG